MIRTVALTIVLCSFFALAAAPPTAPTYENLNAVLWMQTSVEYQASAVQTYRTAEKALSRGLHDPHWTAALEQTGHFENLPPAVILDLDETVLDNSVFQARVVASGEPYSEAAWTNWMKEQKAGLVPGAREFLGYAHAHGVTPLYITNRVCDPSNDQDPTVKLLRSLALQAEPIRERLFCAKDNTGSDKTERRKLCAGKYRVLLLFGDQLGDFLQIPKDAANLEGREKLFMAHQNQWGERWFQFSNPTYGSWEGAVGYSVKEKLAKLRLGS